MVMISWMWVLNTYGEPYNTSSLVECTGYTGKYFLESLWGIQVFYLQCVGVQLPVVKYILYGRGYIGEY